MFCDGLRAGKFSGEPRVTIICGNAENTAFDRKFDRIVVYNAFPQFPNPKRLIKTLSALLKESGRLTIARGASRETIDAHHSGSARKVSNGLMHAEEPANLEMSSVFILHRVSDLSENKGFCVASHI